MSAGHYVVDDLQNIPFAARYEIYREGNFTTTTPMSTVKDWSDPTHPNSVSQATPGFQPQIVNSPIPGFPETSALIFDGVDDFMMSASIPRMNNTDVRCYWIVVRWDSQVPGTFPCAMSGDNTAASGIGDLFIYGGVSTQTLLRFVFAASGSVQKAPLVPIDFYLMSIKADGTNVYCKVGPGVTLGGPAILNSVDAQATDQPNGTFKLMLGAAIQGAPALFLNGKVSAAFVTDTFPTAAQDARIEAYLKRVYGTNA